MVHIYRLLYALFVLILFTLFGCKEHDKKLTSEKEITSKHIGLKQNYKDDFFIGTAVNDALIEKRDSLGLELLEAEFNSITPENIMKWMHIHPGKEVYDFNLPDVYVDLGERYQLFTVGHTLVWHSQLAEWVTEVKDSTELKEVMEDHINTIVGRYKGKIDSWDVVNEALNEDGSLRESVFHELAGEKYLEWAFELAAEADPEAQLTYNDYNLTNPEKRAGAISIVKQLKDKGLKIDVVGMQGHWNLKGPSLKDIEESILAYHNAGVKVAITELDITVLPNPWDLEGAEVSQNFEGSEFMNPYPESLPDSVQKELADRYQSIFKLFLKHKDKIDRVTFWGMNDGSSWLNGWPIKNRTNYPLLFDRSYRPKEAYHSVLALKN